MANSISSVTLDRGLYIVTSAIISFAGMIAAVLLLSLSHTWRVYALLFAFGSAALLIACGVAIGRRWQLFSGMARAIGRLGWIKTWLDGKQSVIEAAENNLFDFLHKTPGMFWGSLALNLATHATAIFEVYVLLFFMGTRKSLMVALVVEALTAGADSILGRDRRNMPDSDVEIAPTQDGDYRSNGIPKWFRPAFVLSCQILEMFTAHLLHSNAPAFGRMSVYRSPTDHGYTGNI